MNSSRYTAISVFNFFKKFLPANGTRFYKSKHDTTIDLASFNASSKRRKDVKACYPILCDFINRAFGADGDFVCKDVSDWPDKSLIAEWQSVEEEPIFTSDYSSGESSSESSDVRRLLSSLATYRVRDEHGKECCTPWAEAGLSCGSASTQNAARNGFSHIMEAVDIRLDADAWMFDSEGRLPATECAREIRGQVCDYVAELMQQQHREFLFTVSIYRTKAYLMHWDRVGTVISEPIDLATEPEQLFKFFFRLRKASDSDAQHGLDSTATAIFEDSDNHPSVLAMKEALAALPDDARVKPYIAKAFGGDLWPYYELEVPDKVSPFTSHTFLVRNLSTRTTSPSPTGRGTKGYIAFDLEMNKFCFLKDAWRADADGVHPEIDVYKRLESLATPIAGIATVLCGGDMYNAVHSKGRPLRQETRTKAGYAPRIHTRIVLNEVGIPLRDYEHSFELCCVVYDAFCAHDDAWSIAKVLHRDISDGNIVIYVNHEHPHKRPRGLLIDWDVCKFEHELSRDPSQKNPVGTWRFMSAALLRFPLKPNEVADDIESFYHLLMLYALRFHRHGICAHELKGILELIYDVSEYHRGYWRGSTTKYRYMATAHLPCRPAGQFGSLLASLAALIQKHYQGLDKELAMYAVPQEDSQTVSSDPFQSSDMNTMKRSTNNSKAPPRRHRIAAPTAITAPEAIPVERTLTTHDQFSALLWGALYDDDEIDKWDANDKLPCDQLR